ncbi:MAG TPA: RagB/SusD family nutrient uptake outer membrane protein, partial [Flavisolibacter sp.]|nr:RagB/SusD family nutrient uptake outer membrane protein [Flavisolibacter sp.]
MQAIKNIKLVYAAFILGAVMTTSCKKTFLELQNPTALSPAQALASEADLQVALRGAYAGMRSANNQGRTIPVLGDLLADNAYISVANSNRYTYGNTLTWTTANSDMLNFWTTSYNVILRANNIINTELKGANVDQLRGEAYTIRALNYFTLVRFFARPYTEDPNNPGVPI